MKDSEWSGLMKVPDREVISSLRVKLGQANAYIDELKAELKEMKCRKVKDTTITQANARINNLEKELEKSRKECNKVVQENIRLKKQLFKTPL